MVILIGGCSHAGKTVLAQRLLEKYHYPYLSIDHLKMGLIRSGMTELAAEDDGQLTEYLWPILREIIKTAIENQQNLVIEGCYIPFDWKNSFSDSYLTHIRYFCLIMTEGYVNRHFEDIKAYANAIEQRKDDSFCTKEMLIKENAMNLKACKKNHCEYLLIADAYNINIENLPL